MENKKYLLISTVRFPFLQPTFHFILWSNKLEIKKVSPELNTKLTNGHFFIMDHLNVKIKNEEIKEAEVIEEDKTIIDSFYDYLEENQLPKEVPTYFTLLTLLNEKTTFLPFLNDTPVFPKKDLPKLEGNPKEMFICYVLMKSRIYYKGNNIFYFQIIVESENQFYKINFWGNAAKLHPAIELSSQIAIKKYKKIPKTETDHLIYNTFYEEIYFDLDAYKVDSSKDVFLMDDEYFISKNELRKLKNWSPSDSKEECEMHLYDVFEKENENESSEYKLQIKRRKDTQLPTTPLNNTVTGTVTYVSTLKKMRTSWKNYNSKEINDQKKSKVQEYFLMRVENKKVILFNSSQEAFYKIKTGKQILLENLRIYKRGEDVFYLSTIYTNICFYGEVKDVYVTNAIGFIPDGYESINESLEPSDEVINGKPVSILPIFRPQEAHLEINLDTMVINETRKYFFKEVMLEKKEECVKCEFIKGNEVVVESIDTFVIKKEATERFVFNAFNYFTNEKKEFKEGFCDLIVDCIKISEDDVLICLSEVFYYE